MEEEKQLSREEQRKRQHTDDQEGKSGSSESIDQFVDLIKSGKLLEDWARLPFLQRARIRLFVKRLNSVFETVELDAPAVELPLELYNVFGSSHIWDFEDILKSENIRQDNPAYPIVAEQEDTQRALEEKIRRIKDAGGVNPDIR